MKPKKLSTKDALAMLPDGAFIHTFRGSGGVMLGADWNRKAVVAAIKEFGCELSGPLATAMRHGICLTDKTGMLFIETRKPT